MFDAIVFAVMACGLRARSALEMSDSGELRLQKIVRLIENARFSIHDLSRIELDTANQLPRFNMPIELGMALGMKFLGRKLLRDHAILVLDSERYRYQKFASDLAGFDISVHDNVPENAIRVTRDFLSAHMPAVPGSALIVELFAAFETTLPKIAGSARQPVSEMTYSDRLRHIEAFLADAGRDV
jgi:hypothetical protein